MNPSSRRVGAQLLAGRAGLVEALSRSTLTFVRRTPLAYASSGAHAQPMTLHVDSGPHSGREKHGCEQRAMALRQEHIN